MRFISPRSLSGQGVLGMNKRNLDFIGRYNDRQYYPLVDNKLKTKILAQESGINVPRLIATVASQHEVAAATDQLQQFNGFAIKPAKGSGGKGIWVISDRDDNGFIKTSGAPVTDDDIERHFSNILSGLYSLSGTPDVAIVEQLIEFDDFFTGLSFQGVPDIRLIVFQGYPVMAMLRCATRASDGKANLHQGAAGIGLDIATGKAVYAVQNGQPVFSHPDTGVTFSDITIPRWREFLVLAAHCYEMTNLGYMGTDMVLDKNQGPMLLELNARPGLAIQVANQEGLESRLRHIETLATRYSTPLERVTYAEQHFHCRTHLQN